LVIAEIKVLVDHDVSERKNNHFDQPKKEHQPDVDLCNGLEGGVAFLLRSALLLLVLREGGGDIGPLVGIVDHWW
jgi:hypothetical protein